MLIYNFWNKNCIFDQHPKESPEEKFKETCTISSHHGHASVVVCSGWIVHMQCRLFRRQVVPFLIHKWNLLATCRCILHLCLIDIVSQKIMSSPRSLSTVQDTTLTWSQLWSLINWWEFKNVLLTVIRSKLFGSGASQRSNELLRLHCALETIYLFWEAVDYVSSDGFVSFKVGVRDIGHVFVHYLLVDVILLLDKS